MVTPIPLRPNDGSASQPASAQAAAPRAGAANANFPRQSLSKSGPKRSADERAFLPAALEVIETPPSPTARISALAICALIVAAIAWATFAHVDMVAVADGKVVPLGQIKVVQPLETAMIRAIHVEEGDHVLAGRLLVDLDPTEARADLDALIYNRIQAELDVEVTRVLLTRDKDEPFHEPAGANPDLAEQSRSQAQREIEKHLAVMAGFAADIAQKRAALEVTAAQIERAELTIPLITEKFETAKALFAKQYGARPPVLDTQQQLVEKQAELKSAQHSVHQIEAEIRSLQAKADEARAGFIADATDRRTKALQRVAQLTQDITKARQKESYRRLVAPVDGTVQGLKIHTPGAVVTTADVLMTIVPDGTGIEIDALVANKDIGFVQEGQAVEIKLEAFPFTRYGLINGRVRKLGRDAAAATPAAPGAPAPNPAAPAELAYPAKISLTQDWILVDGRREPIRPGMRMSAEIKTGDRRVIEYLLSPIVQAMKEAGRER